MTAGQQGSPLELTTARWLNRRTSRGRDHDGHPREKWAKVLAHTGPYEQFAYGTDTPSDWQGQLQGAIICSPGSGVIAIDVDDEAAYSQTRTAQWVRREQAISTRGAGWHALVDARHISRELWPQQGPIPGADIKAKGFVPLPGSRHYSGERYEPVLDGGGKSHIVDATQELIEAMAADRAGFGPMASTTATGHSGGGHRGSSGHDSELYAAVTGWVRQGLGKEACYERWLPLSAPRDPSRLYDREDFERHYRSASGFIERTPAITASPEQVAAAQVMNSRRPQAVPQQGGRTGMEAFRGADPLRITCAQAEAVYAKWLHDPDPVPTRIVLATYAANTHLSGDPVWVMLVGGSGAGKTERIIPVASLPGVVMASTLTGEAALLSATPKRERAGNATGGLLRLVGDKAADRGEGFHLRLVDEPGPTGRGGGRAAGGLRRPVGPALRHRRRAGSFLAGALRFPGRMHDRDRLGPLGAGCDGHAVPVRAAGGRQP